MLVEVSAQNKKDGDTVMPAAILIATEMIEWIPPAGISACKMRHILLPLT